MVLTERQKTEVRNTSKEICKEVLTEFTSEGLFMETLANKVAEIVSQKIYACIEKLTDNMNSLKTEVENLQEGQNILKEKIENLEQITMLNKLRVYGIPEDNGEDLKSKIQNLFESKMELNNVRVNHCYRIGSPHSNNSRRQRPIIVEFESIQQRNIVFYSKGKLKGSKIVITEELVKKRYELLELAREKIGKNRVWSMDGKIYAKVNDKKTWLKTTDDVMKFNNH